METNFKIILSEIKRKKSFIGHSKNPPYNASRDNLTSNNNTGTIIGKLNIGIIMALFPAFEASALIKVKVKEKLKLPTITTNKK